MERRRILGLGIGLIVVVGILLAVWMNKKGGDAAVVSSDQPSQSAEQQQSGQEQAQPQAAPKKSSGLFGGLFSGSKKEDEKAPVAKDGDVAMLPKSEIKKEAPSMPGQETQVVKDSARCVQVSFHGEKGMSRVRRHELVLSEQPQSEKSLCVKIDGQSIPFEWDSKNTSIVLKTRIRKPASVVTATYCAGGKNCQVECPKPSKDFWDAITDDSSDSVVQGFAGNESAEEKQLQKELVNLKLALQQPDRPLKVAKWAESGREVVPCKN